MRARSPSTTARRTIASSPISARSSASVRSRIATSIQVPDVAKLGFAGLIAPAGEIRLAAAAVSQRTVRRQSRDRRVRRHLACLRPVGPIAARAGATAGSAQHVARRRASSASRTRSGSASTSRIWRNTNGSCRPATYASRWRTRYSSISATNSSGRPSWPFPQAPSCRQLGKFGQLGWTTWMAPNWTSTEEYRRDARFHPSERVQRTARAA